ncbi:SH3 domain-containing protein [Treponema sp. OMZ 840]|uniref:SH3 domain-containing protein n=1 Tax=Treponema sp. OMZ 840 TaxID=244313 RepID=UPI003D8A2FFD
MWTPLFAQTPVCVASVRESGLRLRAVPSLNGHIIAVLPEKTPLRVLTDKRVEQVIDGRPGAWVEVAAANGLKGWVYDRWLDIYENGNFYVDENRFNTIEKISYSSETLASLHDSVLEAAVMTDKDEKSLIAIHEYKGGEYTRSYIFDIEQFVFFGHTENFSFEKRVHIAYIAENDFAVSVRQNRDTVVLFRIKDGNLLWKKGFRLKKNKTFAGIIETAVKFDGKKNLYLAFQHNANFELSNYDLHIIKTDLQGNLIQNAGIATESWDMIHSVVCIDEAVYIIADINGIGQGRIIKLNADLQTEKQAHFLFPDKSLRINSVAQNKNTFFISGTSSVVRDNPNMCASIAAVSKDLKLNWSYSLVGDTYNTDFGLSADNTGVVILGHSSKEYVYDLDDNKNVFWLVGFDQNGRRLRENHFIVPYSLEISGFCMYPKRVHVFGYFPYYDTRVYENIQIAKTGFNYVFEPVFVTDPVLSITAVPDTQALVISEFDDYKTHEVVFDVFTPDIHMHVSKTEFTHEYPWNPNVLQTAAFFDLSER